MCACMNTGNSAFTRLVFSRKYNFWIKLNQGDFQPASIGFLKVTYRSIAVGLGKESLLLSDCQEKKHVTASGGSDQKLLRIRT